MNGNITDISKLDYDIRLCTPHLLVTEYWRKFFIAEILSLEGATETIKKFKPKLAICVYHKDDDCKKIPEFILKCNPNYELHFGWHNQRDGWESILYAK